MRHYLSLLAGGIVLAAVFVGCTAEVENPEVDITSIRCSIAQIDVEEDFATGILDTLSVTKATITGSSFLWSAGDRIGILPNTGSQIYFAVTNGAGTSSASFDGGDWAMKSTGTFYAYYPLYPDIFLTKDHVPVSYIGQTQSGNNNTLHTGEYWTLFTGGTTAVGNTLNFSFNHMTSFFKTYVTVPAGTYTKISFTAPSNIFIKEGYFDLSAQTPAIVGTTMTDELTLNLENVTFAEETELSGYLVVAPVDIAGVPITVTVFKDGVATYEYTLAKANNMVASKTYAFRATVLTQLASSVSQANTLFASGATAVTITEPLTADATVVLPDTGDAVTLTLPTTASSSKLTVSYDPGASSYPATLSITGPEGADLDIQTPSSTVTVNGVAYDQITSRTAANTCIIPAGVTVTTLKVIQGGVQVYGTVSQIDLSEQEDDAIINVSGTVSSLLGEDSEEYSPATGVSLNQSSINLNVGATETLTATVAPYGAYPNVIWTSSDEAVATVSSAGVITAVSEGSATISAKTIFGGLIAYCSLTVMPSIIHEPLTFTSKGSTTVSLVKYGTPDAISLEYKVNDGPWTSYNIGNVVSLNNQEKVSFKAGTNGNSSFSQSYSNFYKFTLTGSGTIVASGNVMSLLDSTNESLTIPCNYCFYKLFCFNDVLTAAPALPATTLASGCYGSMFEGCSSLIEAPALPATTLASGCYGSMFEGCSSLIEAPALPATTLAGGCYAGMFSTCTSLTEAPTLPATALADGCYQYMFRGCTSLIESPSLPATTLRNNCYNYMFLGCTSLTVAGGLSAVILAESCCSDMFYGCTSLTEAPTLPATSLASNCYYQMFYGCSSLTEAPTLPATSLANGCYYQMFYGCSSLTEAPTLPANVLAGNCYQLMFANCIALIEAPALPATTLANGCYAGMFRGCTSLTSAPNLPVTTLTNRCYSGMFEGCTSLFIAPALPATTLAEDCYSSMFYGCTNLIEAPELPATNLVSSCYSYMFKNCSRLEYIKALFKSNDLPSIYSREWVSGVASTGIFIKNKDAKWDETKIVPSGWTVIKDAPLMFKSTGITSISLKKSGNPSNSVTLQFNKNDVGWEEYTIGDLISLDDGDYVLFRAGENAFHPGENGNEVFSRGLDDYFCFSMSGDGTIAASGNIMSLLDITLLQHYVPSNAFFKLFVNCRQLTNAPELPATTLASGCYQYMFLGCSNLTTAPNLPATRMEYDCYCGMFYNCYNLVNAPALPATTLASGCYCSMFYCCASLETAPELPATTLANDCYSGMFEACTSLTSAPDLPASTLVRGCYNRMFYYCTHLNSVKCLATNPTEENCSNWLYGVPSNGTFVKSADISWPSGDSGIPVPWTVLTE